MDALAAEHRRQDGPGTGPRDAAIRREPRIPPGRTRDQRRLRQPRRAPPGPRHPCGDPFDGLPDGEIGIRGTLTSVRSSNWTLGAGSFVSGGDDAAGGAVAASAIGAAAGVGQAFAGGPASVAFTSLPRGSSIKSPSVRTLRASETSMPARHRLLGLGGRHGRQVPDGDPLALQHRFGDEGRLVEAVASERLAALGSRRRVLRDPRLPDDLGQWPAGEPGREQLFRRHV